MMHKLNTLPSDVLESLFLSLQNVDDLRALALTCKHLCQTFLDRRDLILSSIFVSQVTHPEVRIFNGQIVLRTPHRNCGRKQPEETRRVAEAIISKCQNTPTDAALLHAAIWQVLIRASPGDEQNFDRKWGEKLMARYRAIGDEDAELQVAEGIWSYLTSRARGKSFHSRYMAAVMKQAGVRLLVQRLHLFYRRRQRYDDALNVLKEAISYIPQHLESELVVDLVKSFRQLERRDEAIAYEYQQYSKALQDSMAHGVNANAMTWARHLCREYILANRPEDAIRLQREVFDRRLAAPRGRDPANLAHLTGWARQLIQQLKQAGREEEALATKAQMFEMLLPPGGRGFSSRYTPTSLLLGWSRELVHHYVALDRRLEAIAIEKAIWEHLLESSHRSPKDRTKGYHLRNAAIVLAESYKKFGETHEAEEVIRLYDTAAVTGGWKMQFSEIVVENST